jgi:hypothetical protein
MGQDFIFDKSKFHRSSERNRPEIPLSKHNCFMVLIPFFFTISRHELNRERGSMIDQLPAFSIAYQHFPINIINSGPTRGRYDVSRCAL